MGLQGRHKSLDKELKRSVLWLESIPAVKKVVLGFSENCRHKYSPGVVRFKNEVPGGIKVNGYAGFGVVDMFIKIEPIEEVENVKAQILKKYL